MSKRPVLKMPLSLRDLKTGYLVDTSALKQFFKILVVAFQLNNYDKNPSVVEQIKWEKWFDIAKK